MKNTKRNKINLIFSSFLVIGFIVCSYFFSTLADQIAGFWGPIIKILVPVVFGLLLFYATRVGEGKQVRRFSLAVLLLVVIPCAYIIAAFLIESLPLHNFIAGVTAADAAAQAAVPNPSLVLMLACIALGYGIPYTFLSGYELDADDDEDAADEEELTVVEGGLAEELAEIEEEEQEENEAEEVKAEEEPAEEEKEEAKEKDDDDDQSGKSPERELYESLSESLKKLDDEE